MRKMAASAKSRRSRKAPKRRKSGPAKKSAPAAKKPAPVPALAGVRPPPPGRGKRGERGYLAYLLRQAQAASRLTMERALADLGVTPPQFVVLTMLRAYPGLSGADLARVALLTPQTVGVIIRNLERSGAIRKTPHPVHGRVLMWTLTRRGGTLLEKCRRHVQAVERRLTAGLSAKAQATVRRWLSKIAADLSQEA
ncbi:MarR family transcriptional regulator [Bradyrhizobium sediminis]|uniref:MarR family transcriptional regulator n=1 Tax=Bradyrhizobium sediminis TaxID=2840469 RepID=A0A975NAZ3_9BRAD|nr:MarR family transcriptional regulator [Bradyrhizobium sediminis]QWG11199.1 MarR family transcriptional regulator [Bradyrhizobium sediminis]